MVSDIKLEPVAFIGLTLDEAQLLMDLAVQHYDRKCRQAGEHGGIIWKLYGVANFEAKNGESKYKPLHVHARADEVDTICKVLELAPLDNMLGVKFRNLLADLAIAGANANGGVKF